MVVRLGSPHGCPNDPQVKLSGPFDTGIPSEAEKDRANASSSTTKDNLTIMRLRGINPLK
jgi:hypothetical protein